MKISPMSPGGVVTGSIETGRTSPELIERAKQIALGETTLKESDTPVDPQVRKAQESIRRIKMKVNQSPDRTIEDATPEVPTPEPPPVTPSATTPENNEVASDETKPLSPQFAALARQRRALQVKERELSERERALESRPQGDNDLLGQLKSQPLRVLQEQGILTPEFYNQFTEFLVSGQSTANSELFALKQQIKDLKDGIDKTWVERDTDAEKQVLREMRKEAELLTREGDEFELVRETKSIPQVIDLIYRTYKKSGEVLDVSEALKLIEDQLFEDSLKLAQLKKIQAKFQPQPLPQQPKPQMRTLTNRDTAAPPLDRRSRAIMAALGQLKG